MSEESPPARPVAVLVAAVLLVLVVPHVPVLRWVLAPVYYLGTLVHELGHAAGALAIGGKVHSVEVWRSGAGQAMSSYWSPTPLKRAIVSAGGLVGPAAASVGLLWLGMLPRPARVGLVVLGLGLLGVGLTVAEGFAVPLALGWGAAAVLAGWKLPGQLARLSCLVIAVQLALHVYRRSSYLFTEVAHTDAGTSASDVAKVASALGGHYLFWGVAIGAFDVLLLGIGLLGFFYGDRVFRRVVERRAS